MAKTFNVRSWHQTFEFAAFIDLLNELEPAMVEPCDVVVDLSHPHFFGPSGMVPLLALISDLCDRDWTIRVGPPDDPLLEDYWKKAGWLDALNGTEPPEPASMSTFAPLASYSTPQQLNERMQILMDVLAKVSEFEPGVLRAVEWTVNELAGNVLDHSGGATGWIQIVARPKQNRVDLVVADRDLASERRFAKHSQRSLPMLKRFGLPLRRERLGTRPSDKATDWLVLSASPKLLTVG